MRKDAAYLEKLALVPEIPKKEPFFWDIEYKSKCTCGGTITDQAAYLQDAINAIFIMLNEVR